MDAPQCRNGLYSDCGEVAKLGIKNDAPYIRQITKPLLITRQEPFFYASISSLARMHQTTVFLCCCVVV